MPSSTPTSPACSKPKRRPGRRRRHHHALAARCRRSGGALAIAEYASLRHGLDTPDRFERDTPSIVAEQLAEEAMRQLEAPHDDTDEGRVQA
nr:phage terminase small subunit [Halolamina pelagica]